MSKLGTHAMPVYQPWSLAHNNSLLPAVVDVPAALVKVEVGRIEVVQDHVINVPTAILN